MSDNGIILTSPDQINAFALLSLKGRLKLEALGMKGRGASAFSQVKSITGLKAKTARDMIPLFESYLREQGVLS
jgi:hypothetical protein